MDGAHKPSDSEYNNVVAIRRYHGSKFLKFGVMELSFLADASMLLHHESSKRMVIL
jgi:hypothetical protein